MKYNKILKISAAIVMFVGALFTLSSCSTDDYADINTNPATIGKPNIPFLFTQAEINFEPSDYLLWFYNGAYTTKFAQSYTPSGSFGDLFNQLGELGGEGSQFIAVKNYENEIKDVVSRMGSEESAKYNNVLAMTNTLSVYLAMFDSDMFGSMPYSEAAQLRYGGTLTPKYDSQKELFDEWLTELNNDIKILVANETNQIQMGSNDIVYNGTVAKWLKFANAVKLKIAARLLHQDKAKALAIAAEVGANDAYVMSGSDDDFVYNKGTGGDGGDNTYHFGNSVGLGAASKNVIDFMIKNKDPRLLVMFTKNNFNSEVVQSFFDAQALDPEVRSAIPQYILNNVEYTTDADGHKHFKAWKGLGEPWVRYYGIPIGLNLNDKDEYIGDNNYFVSTRWEVTLNKKSKTYRPYSTFNEELVRGRVDFTYPTAPDGKTLQDTEDQPWYGMAISTAEVNLYLAEFKLLGANLPKSAADYFKTAVKSSAEEYNRLATLNKIPYYDADHCKDANEKPITYGSDEINNMLTSADYQLTGNKASDLEKVYIQMYLHFMYQPIDQYVTVRRSGVPKVNSTLIPWVNLKANTEIPRRFYVSEAKDEDKMKAQMEAAYAEEGFTPAGRDNPSMLNKERVWYDKGAPNFGEGPNY